MITAHGDMESVIESLRYGASDFLTKPFRLLNLKTAIERTKRFVALQNRITGLKFQYDHLISQIKDTDGMTIIGKSKAMRDILDLMKKVAGTDNTTILVTGESGTGKEIVARGIHTLSNRKNRTFLDINCSSIPDNLFESEFFGHKKGSFTGAIDDKAGWFEIADNGTLFLDEISDMPIGQQAKLLRVLEERKVSKVGSRDSKQVDVRVIAASNTNLEKLASENKFRLDLFHRLNVFSIVIPPLRERKEDIQLLLNYYLKQYSIQMQKNVSKIDPVVISQCMEYDFPGNIRELKNIIERAVILCDGGYNFSRSYFIFFKYNS